MQYYSAKCCIIEKKFIEEIPCKLAIKTAILNFPIIPSIFISNQFLVFYMYALKKNCYLD